MQDPRHQYPEPPFPRQPQPAPGLVAHMQPKPDHGETSYHGSGKLNGRKALVTGADSGIGRAADVRERDIVIVGSELSMRQVAAGLVPFETALEQRVVALDAGQQRAAIIRMAWNKAFSKVGFSRFVCA